MTPTNPLLNVLLLMFTLCCQGALFGIVQCMILINAQLLLEQSELERLTHAREAETK